MRPQRFLGLLALVVGCGTGTDNRRDASSTPNSRPANTAHGSATLRTTSTASRSAPVAETSGEAHATSDPGHPALGPHARSAASFRSLMAVLSEPDAEFFSDNYVSNETSYLQVAPRLAEVVEPDGVYVGVGPEQNFTYIALSKPRYAYIVDIRRDNLVLHLMYKALFDLSRSRAELAALLIGRRYDHGGAPGADAPVTEVLAYAEQYSRDEATFRFVHRRLEEQITRTYGIALDDTDRQTLWRTHQAFFNDGLDLHFTLKGGTFRTYPPLRELLAARDPSGERSGFLASEASYRLLQTMQREHRIVPLVGDLAGDRAMPGLAKHLHAQGTPVSTFYVSNVEQYLLQQGLWWKWQRNVGALPSRDDGVFIRAYLDQGHKHPLQMNGHRTTSSLHRLADFKTRVTAPPSMLALASSSPL